MSDRKWPARYLSVGEVAGFRLALLVHDKEVPKTYDVVYGSEARPDLTRDEAVKEFARCLNHALALEDPTPVVQEDWPVFDVSLGYQGSAKDAPPRVIWVRAPSLAVVRKKYPTADIDQLMGVEDESSIDEVLES